MLKRVICISLLVFVATILAIFIFIGQERELIDKNKPIMNLDDKNPIGMFAWDEGAIKEPEKTELLIKRLSITRWYQEMNINGSSGEIRNFISTLYGKKVEVYALIGSVEWGYEKDGKSLIEQIYKIRSYNKKARENEKIAGIMVDVEPYTSSRWDNGKLENMENYVSGMIEAYNYGRDNNLSVAICIPRHYDDQGLSEQLERLIGQACDEVAVMNYDCGLEIQKIATEARFAKEYDKELHCILEFQQVGKHGLTEDKTYRNKGIAKAQEAWDKVDKAYPAQMVVRDYHWTKPLEEMLKEARDDK